MVFWHVTKDIDFPCLYELHDSVDGDLSDYHRYQLCSCFVISENKGKSYQKERRKMKPRTLVLGIVLSFVVSVILTGDKITIDQILGTWVNADYN